VAMAAEEPGKGVRAALWEQWRVVDASTAFCAPTIA